ncbi:TPA: hypothetical protein ACIFE8_002351 [Yersinia enterocolitica]
MSKLINNRPAILEKIPHYSEIPDIPVALDFSSTIHGFLKFDIDDLDGLQPIENKYIKECGKVFNVNPSEDLISAYEKRKIDFQLINIIVNAYGFEEKDGVLVGKPYSISLKPMEKRGKVQTQPADYFRNFNLEDLKKCDYSYLGFNPFTQGYQMFGSYSSFISHGPLKQHSDMVGFVTNTYALATKWDFDDVCIPSMPKCNPYLVSKFAKYRTRRYFKKFENCNPRKIWGCDSPIELFLLHALNTKNLSPEIQTGIYEDGSTHPSLHQMISSNKREAEVRQITDEDFYFPESKLAIFCDSNMFHNNNRARINDEKIDNHLQQLGVKSLRISGPDIIEDPYKCVGRVIDSL